MMKKKDSPKQYRRYFPWVRICSTVYIFVTVSMAVWKTEIL